MDGEELFSGLVAFCLLATGLVTTFLLLQHLSSILAIRWMFFISYILCNQADHQEDSTHPFERAALLVNCHMLLSKGGIHKIMATL